MHTGLTDTEIISRVLNGEQQVFTQLVDRYKGYVFTLALRMVESREDAEEVSQDIFVKAYRSLADFRGFKIQHMALHHCEDNLHYFLTKEKLIVTSIDNEKTMTQIENQESDFQADSVERKSRHAMVNEVIRMLHPDDAQIITLFYKGEQSLDEMGTILGLEPNNVKVKLHRARQKLKEKWKNFSAMKYVSYKAIQNGIGNEDNCAEFCNGVNEKGKNNFMNEQLNVEERLWDYIDDLSSPGEKSVIEELIQTNFEWKKKYLEVLEAHHLMQGTELDEPSMRFTKNVMEEIAKFKVAPATRSYLNKKIIWGIGGFFIVMILSFVVYAISQVNYVGGSTPQIVNEYNNTLNRLDWSKIFSSAYTNVFMMINVVLGLMMLDIYLTRKKQRGEA